MKRFPLRLYNTETTKTLTRQDFFEKPQVKLTHLDVNSLDFGSLKNGGRGDKSNYRPISILSVSKIYERCLYSQLYDYFDKNIFSKYQCRFRKGISTQHALLVMIEKMKAARDNKDFAQLFSQIY